MFLSPLQARLLFQVALEERFAILAINADSPAAITDCLEAAREVDAPVIIETSLWQLNGRSFGAGDPALGLARYLVQLILLAESDRYRDLPVLLHTDHIQGPVTLPLLRAAVRGLPTGVSGTVASPSTLSLDSSRLTATENIEAIVSLARESAACGRPVTLEMEAGIDDGVTPPAVTESLLGQVESRAPGVVHLWAPGVGTRHGLTDSGGFSAD
ncbi:MAG: class II fructose-bisphosphate aldolase, partial [Verrucomicrobiota bacterium]